MKTTRLNRAENISADEFPVTTPEEERQDLENLFNELGQIAEKLPPDSFPEQTLSEILKDFHRPKTTIITRSDGQQLMIRGGVVTVLAKKADAPEDTKKNASEVTESNVTDVTFTDDELAILEQLKDVET